MTGAVVEPRAVRKNPMNWEIPHPSPAASDPAAGNDARRRHAKIGKSQSPADDRDNPSLVAIRRLRRGVAIIVKHGDAETANWWASRINEYEGSVRHGFNRLDEILRLIPPKGGRSWADIEKLKQRDHWLRVAARRHYSGCPSSTAQAKLIVAALKRFKDGDDWPEAKSFASPPPAWVGTPRECWFNILKCGPILAVSTLRRILDREGEDGV